MFVKENKVFCMTKHKVPLSGHFGSRWTVAPCIKCYFEMVATARDCQCSRHMALQCRCNRWRTFERTTCWTMWCGTRLWSAPGPGARHQTPRGAASNGSFSIAVMCSTTRWFQSDSHSSSPCGISIQPGEENSSCKRWRGLGSMDGGKPFWRPRPSPNYGT